MRDDEIHPERYVDRDSRLPTLAAWLEQHADDVDVWLGHSLSAARDLADAAAYRLAARIVRAVEASPHRADIMRSKQ